MVPDIGMVRNPLRTRSEERTERTQVWLGVCNPELSDNSEEESWDGLTWPGKRYNDQVPTSSSTHRHERLGAKLVSLQYVDLPAHLPFEILVPILSIASKDTKVDFGRDAGMRVGHV